jgi:dTDP-glucose pyrophosphorylase
MEKEKKITGVILAAGLGTRMGSLPTELPKAVLPVLNRPIIFHQLKMMESVGIEDVYIVVGYNSHILVQCIERSGPLDMNIHYKQQSRALGIAHSISVLEQYIKTPMLILLGDIYFDAPNIHQMLEKFESSSSLGVLAAVKEDNADVISRNYCIIENDEGAVTRVIEKPRYPQSNLKGVGIYLFDPIFFDAIRRTPRTAMRDEYEITDSIQIMINDGYAVSTSMSVIEDINVTSPQDLLGLNLRLLDRSRHDKLVGVRTAIGNNTSIKRSVVGANCVISDGVIIENSLVFDNCTVPEGSSLRNAIFTEKQVYYV